MIKKIFMLSFTALLLVSCVSNKQNEKYDESYIKDTNGFDILIGQFAHNIENIWGFKNILIAGPKDYVQYTDAYQTRTHINFDKGIITIETIVNNDPLIHLRQAIRKILLMSDNFNSINFYSDIHNTKIFKEPFLYGQVIDQTGQPIRWKKRATNFAQYLLKTRLKRYKSGLRIIYSVTINLVPNHLDKRIYKYIRMVRKASHKYNIDESLILAIIQTESSFNPYAISHSDALGLMQVVQHSAGKDVFRRQGKHGIPSQSYLLDPENNIDVGTAYLSILNTTYLGNINNPTSRRYAVISAYNSGVRSVLRIFSNNRFQATNIINDMSPKDVYIKLATLHPSIESRKYLYKVNLAQTIYCHK